MTVPKSPRVFASISGGRPESFIFGFSPAVSCLLLYLICGSRHASRDRVTLPYFVLCCVICIRNIAHALMSAGCPLYVADLSLCCMRGKRHSCAACLFRVWLVWLVDDVSADARFNFLSVPSLQCGHWWELYRVCACVRGVWLALTASVWFFWCDFFDRIRTDPGGNSRDLKSEFSGSGISRRLPWVRKSRGKCERRPGKLCSTDVQFRLWRFD